MTKYGVKYKLDMIEDSSGAFGSINQVLTVDDNNYQVKWKTPSGGGGGTIGGGITATQVAFGATTTDEIDGNSTFTFVKSGTGSSAQTLLEVGDGDSSEPTSKGSVHITAKQVDDSTSRARFQLETSSTPTTGSELRGYLQCSGTSSDVTLLSNANLVLSGDANVTIEPGSTNDITMATSSGSGVGIGTTTPSKKLTVNGTIYSEQASGEVMIAGNSAFSTKYITIREGSNYAARWGLQATNDIVTNGVMLMSSSKPMAFRSSTNIAFDSVSLSHLIIRASSTNGSANIGMGTDDPQSKLQVDGGIQMADDTDAAAATKVGTMRYRTGTEYVEVDGVELVTNGDKNVTIVDVINFAKTHHLENLIAVDNTASADFVTQYIPLIEAGFDLVSCNKIANTLSFDFYKKLRSKLKEYKKQYLYETNVGAGLPLIDTIRLLHESGENITRIRGVFSGTLSYLFNTFSSQEISFSTVLQDAISKGFTEPDPRDDLAGVDVARKLLILARELDLENELHEVDVQNLIPENLRNGTVTDFLSNLELELDQVNHLISYHILMNKLCKTTFT